MCWYSYSTQIRTQARDMVSKKIQSLTHLFRKRKPLHTHTLSGISIQYTHILLTHCGFTFHCLDRWNEEPAPALSFRWLISTHSLTFFFLLLGIFSWSELSYFVSVAGLEPYMVHSQPRLNPVFSEHYPGVGPLCLSLVAGPLLLPSPLLSWPWAHSNVLPLLRKDGEAVLHFTDNAHKGSRSLNMKSNTLTNLNAFSCYLPLLLRCLVSCWPPLALWNSSISCWRGAKRLSITWSSYSAPSYAAWLW